MASTPRREPAGVVFAVDCGARTTRAIADGGGVVRVPTVLGRARVARSPPSLGTPTRPRDAARRQEYVGEDALARGADLAWPLAPARGLPPDWDAAERIWLGAMAAAAPGASAAAVVLTRPLLAPARTVDRVRRFGFSVAARVCLVEAPVLALLGSGTETGICVDVGATAARAVPVVGGAAVPHAARAAASLGGDALAAHCRDYVARGLPFASPAAAAAAGTAVKETAAVVTSPGQVPAAVDVPLDPAWTSAQRRLGSPARPAPSVLVPGADRAALGDRLFGGSAPDAVGLHDLAIAAAVAAAEGPARARLLGNVQLVPGLAARLQSELRALAADPGAVRVRAEPARADAAVKGAAALAGAGALAWETRGAAPGSATKVWCSPAPATPPAPASEPRPAKKPSEPEAPPASEPRRRRSRVEHVESELGELRLLAETFQRRQRDLDAEVEEKVSAALTNNSPSDRERQLAEELKEERALRASQEREAAALERELESERASRDREVAAVRARYDEAAARFDAQNADLADKVKHLTTLHRKEQALRERATAAEARASPPLVPAPAPPPPMGALPPQTPAVAVRRTAGAGGVGTGLVLGVCLAAGAALAISSAGGDVRVAY